MKNQVLLTLLASSLVALTSGCTTSSIYPVTFENASTRGTPVVTRISASDQSFRFLGLGGTPSIKRALDKLYANASANGYHISGNNYAFQNIISEKKVNFLYPILGSSTITVCADIYAYENRVIEEGTHDENSK